MKQELKPTVLAVCGLPTSGKTTLAREVARSTGLYLVDIDEGPVSCTYPPEPDPYATEVGRGPREIARSRISYIVLHAAVRANLAERLSLIVTATYSRHSSQDFLQVAANEGGGILKMVLCEYDDTDEEIERRLRSRDKNYKGGCRTRSHYRDDQQRWAGIKLPHIVVRMEGDDEGTRIAVEQVLAYLSHG